MTRLSSPSITLAGIFIQQPILELCGNILGQDPRRTGFEWAGLRYAQRLAPTWQCLPYLHTHRRASLPARHFLHLQQLFRTPEQVCYGNWVRNSHQQGCRLIHHLLLWENPAHRTSLWCIGTKGLITNPVFSAQKK